MGHSRIVVLFMDLVCVLSLNFFGSTVFWVWHVLRLRFVAMSGQGR